MSLPTWKDIQGLTVGQAAELAYPGITFDTALPQYMVDDLIDYGFDPRGKCVTLYRSGCIGELAGLCEDWQSQLLDAIERSVNEIIV